MAGEFSLNTEQNNKLKEITNNGEGNYAAGYDYLHQQIQIFLDAPENANNPDLQAYKNTNYWLEKAAEINRNDPKSEANAYIREVTHSGLLFDGKNADPAKIQENSDKIGKAVIKDILSRLRIPGIGKLLEQDVQSALKDGGQTLAGWGGSFYYWDMPMSDKPNDTVGNRIINDPVEYEKFLAITTKAALETMSRLGMSFEQFETASKAQVPEKVMSEIMDRTASVLDYGDGQSDYMGNPDEIGGYRTSIEQDGAVIGWYQLDKNLQRVPLKDQAAIDRLNKRRNLRLEKGISHPWQTPSTQARVDKVKLKDGTLYEHTYGDGGHPQKSIKTSPDGTRIEKHYDAANGKVAHEMRFDSHGKQTTQLDFNADGTKTERKFDPATGKVTQEKRFDKDGHLTFDSVEEARKKAEAEQAAAKKAEADRIAAEQAAAKKAEADKLAAEKAAADKAREEAEAAAADAAFREEQRKRDEQSRAELQKRQEEERKRVEEAQKELNENIKRTMNETEAIRKREEEERRERYREIEEERKRNRHLGGGRPDVSIGRGKNGGGDGGGVQVCFPNTGQCSGSPVFFDLNRDGNIAVTQLTEKPASETSLQETALTTATGLNNKVKTADVSSNSSDPAAVTPQFDWNGDGVPDPTAWVGSEDAMLVIDLAKDGTIGPDGLINQPKEIAFSLWKTEEERVAELKEKGIDDTGNPITDLEGLRWALDSNHDNILDSRDARWNEFGLWQDANQNGIADTGELLTMDQAGINLINLMPSNDGSKAFPDGSAITGTSSAEMSDGTKMLIGDVSLVYKPSLAS